MASFAAFLEVGGKRYLLFRYELSMHQETDTLGRPASPVLGGTIVCTLSSPGQQGGAESNGMPSSLIQLQISPQRVPVGAITHDNNWPVASHGSGQSFVRQEPQPSPKKDW